MSRIGTMSEAYGTRAEGFGSVLETGGFSGSTTFICRLLPWLTLLISMICTLLLSLEIGDLSLSRLDLDTMVYLESLFARLYFALRKSSVSLGFPLIGQKSSSDSSCFDMTPVNYFASSGGLISSPY